MGRIRRGQRRKQREHRPWELGPRLYRTGRYWRADFRPWGWKRVTLRNPKHPSWPDDGERTENEPLAREWAWAYVAWLQGAEVDRLRGKVPAKPLGPALDEWLEATESMNAPVATYRNRGTVAKHLRAHLGERADALRVTRDNMQALVRAWIGAGYAPGTINTYAFNAGAFFEHIGHRDNPARKIDLPEIPRGDPVAWSDAEIERVRKAADRIDAAGKHPLPARLFVELALATGARAGELQAIRWEDFDAHGETVRIQRQIQHGKVVPLKGKDAGTAIVLPSWRPHHHPATGYVLGEPVNKSAREATVGALLDEAKLNGPGVGAHRFRHTYARLFIEEHDGEVYQLSASLRHKSVTTTENAYGHFKGSVATRTGLRRIHGRDS